MKRGPLGVIGAMLIAVGHIVGAVVAVFVFGFAVRALGTWEQERNRKAAVQETSIVLGISPDEIDDPVHADPVHAERITRFLAERFSSELFRNRLSDFSDS